MVYHSLGINWIWYLDVTIGCDGVTINRHYRIHKYEGDKHPESVGEYDLIESKDGKRTIIAAKLNNVICNVENPKYIFDYTNY